MESRGKQQTEQSTTANVPVCECCQGVEHKERRMPRREFLTYAGGVVIGASALGSVLPAGRVWAQAKAPEAAVAAAASSPESMVKVLYDMLSAKQRETICFPWDHKDDDRGLLRTRIAANWDITENY